MAEGSDSGDEIIALNEETLVHGLEDFDEDELALAIPGNAGSAIVPRNSETQIAVPSNQNELATSQPAEVVIGGGNYHGTVFGPQTNKRTLKANDYRHAKISHKHVHHHYGRDQEKSKQKSASASAKGSEAKLTSEPDEGYVQISEDIFMCNKEPLRKGTKVYKGYQQHASGNRRPLAIKVIFGCDETQIKEVKHLLTLSPHPNIVQIIQSKERHGTTRELYIAMELCEQNLQDYIQENREKNAPLDFDQTMSFSKQLVAGLKFIHSQKIVHRDFKPENVLKSSGQLKLSDFGISKQLRPDRSITKQTSLGQGSAGYMAPEAHSSDVISRSADIFPLGITLHGLWSNGRHPFGDHPLLRDYNIVQNKGHDLSGLLISGIKKDQLVDLIDKTLQHDPLKRPSIEEIAKHPFFSSESATMLRQDSASGFNGITETVINGDRESDGASGIKVKTEAICWDFEFLKQRPKFISIGIDLGNTNSSFAVMRNEAVEVISDDRGNRVTPSYVAFTEHERFIGIAAKYQCTWNPSNTVYDANKMIGRNFDDPAVQDGLTMWPFKVFEEDGRPKIRVSYQKSQREFCPEEISSMIIQKMKSFAEDFIGGKVHGAVITVPAYFNDAQRRATKDAAAIAGLHVLGLLNEPTAAALAYGLSNKPFWMKSKQNILVYDLGGSTFDVTILTLHDGLSEIKATGGDPYLGGQDFNQRLYEYYVGEFTMKTGRGVLKNDRAISRILEECERTKKMLSSTQQTNVFIEVQFYGEEFGTEISRARFEQLNEDLFRTTMEIVERALEDAKMVQSEINDVVLVGGSTHIPYVQKMLENYFGKGKIRKTIDPDEVVAYGAAVYAAFLSADWLP